MMVHACFTCSTAHGILNLYFLALLCLRGSSCNAYVTLFQGDAPEEGSQGSLIYILDGETPQRRDV